jgi:hypothetical protein
LKSRTHSCPNAYCGDGAKGACYVNVSAGDKSDHLLLEVGWSCVVVHHTSIPVSWLAELVAIATGHDGGIVGFLREHDYGNPSYALMCDPPSEI